MKHKLKLGFSPCPNDTFIFDALVNGRIDTEELEFEPVLADVEELNRMAGAGVLDVTKLSYNAYAYVHHRYQLLNAGSALGRNCGPLLIAKQNLGGSELKDARIAIPGHRTTANFLMSFAFPEVRNKEEFLFSEIEKAVLDSRADAGVIIHENRFTYAERGLLKLADLGEVWESRTGCPIPLGGIAVHRRWKPDIRSLVDRLVHDSVAFAFRHPEVSAQYVTCHAQEMDEEVMRAHIKLYVNDFTLDLGKAGKSAIRKMYQVGSGLGMPEVRHALFVEQ